MEVSSIQKQLDAFILNSLAREDSTAEQIFDMLDQYLSRYRVSLLTICSRLNVLQDLGVVKCLEFDSDPMQAVFCVDCDDLPLFALDDDMLNSFADDNDIPLFDDPSDDDVYLLIGKDDRWELHLYDQPLTLKMDQTIEDEDEDSPVEAPIKEALEEPEPLQQDDLPIDDMPADDQLVEEDHPQEELIEQYTGITDPIPFDVDQEDNDQADQLASFDQAEPVGDNIPSKESEPLPYQEQDEQELEATFEQPQEAQVQLDNDSPVDPLDQTEQAELILEQEVAQEPQEEVPQNQDPLAQDDLFQDEPSQNKEIIVEQEPKVEPLQEQERQPVEEPEQAHEVVEPAAQDIEPDLSAQEAQADQEPTIIAQDSTPICEPVAEESTPAEPISYEQISVFDEPQPEPVKEEPKSTKPEPRKGKKDKKSKDKPDSTPPVQEEVTEPTPIEKQIADEESERRLAALIRLGMVTPPSPVDHSAEQAYVEQSQPEIVPHVEASYTPSPVLDDVHYDSMRKPTNNLESYLSETEVEHKFMYRTILFDVFRDVVQPAPQKDESDEVSLVTSITELREEMRKKGYVVNQYVAQNTYQYYSKKYILVNKLNLVTSLVTYLFGLALILVALFAVDPYIHWGWDKYVIAAVCMLIFPGFRLVSYLLYRDRHAPADYSFKFSFATSWMAAIILMMIDLLIAFFIPIPGTNANISVIESMIIPVFYPAALLLLLPIRSLINFALYSTKRFHL